MVLHFKFEELSITDMMVDHLVVIHDRVERLDPHRINVPVQHNPLGRVAGEVGQVPHDGGEEAVLPLPRGRVDEAKELVGVDGLGVEVLPDGLPLEVVVGPVQGPQYLRQTQRSTAARNKTATTKRFKMVHGVLV